MPMHTCTWRHLGALGRGERGELSGLAEHQVGTPTLDRRHEKKGSAACASIQANT